ncbi:MAG: signal peptidase I [Clostridia bacterium]|nr:signal peptidase I [Clostridia bacterium]
MSIQHGVKKEMRQKPQQKKSLLREMLSFLGTLLCAAVLLFVFQSHVAQFIRVDGTSMTNTLQNGEIVLVSKLNWDFQRNDVVICHYPGRLARQVNVNASIALTQHEIFVKRLVALPGDSVMVRGGKLYVNGELAPNPERMGSVPRDYPLRTLGEDEYFVIGDNRFTSHDSRADDVGPISGSMLRGKVKCVLWPLSAIRQVE